MSTLVIGCGFLGERVATLLLRRGECVYGTVRSSPRSEEIRRLGIEPILVDVLEPDTLVRLPDVDRVLFCVGYDRTSGTDMRTVYVQGLSNVLEHLSGSVTRLVHASSTSVYGQNEGEWVDEDSETVPVQKGGKICLEAEDVVRRWANDRHVSAASLRFSGLYGSGRVIRRALIERGEPIPGDPTRYLNLIHIDDAARAAVAALDAAQIDPVYVISDDRPVAGEYYALVARLLWAPSPRFVSSSPGSGEGKDDGSNRRIRNRRMRENLGVNLLFPDITMGVPAALGHLDRTFDNASSTGERS